MTEIDLTEELASLEHERWSHWQNYLHSKAKKLDDGSLLLPADLVRRWTKQMQTKYADLSFEEQQSDREQVIKVLPTIRRYISQLP